VLSGGKSNQIENDAVGSLSMTNASLHPTNDLVKWIAAGTPGRVPIVNRDVRKTGIVFDDAKSIQDAFKDEKEVESQILAKMESAQDPVSPTAIAKPANASTVVADVAPANKTHSQGVDQDTKTNVGDSEESNDEQSEGLAEQSARLAEPQAAGAGPDKSAATATNGTTSADYYGDDDPENESGFAADDETPPLTDTVTNTAAESSTGTSTHTATDGASPRVTTAADLPHESAPTHSTAPEGEIDDSAESSEADNSGDDTTATETEATEANSDANDTDVDNSVTETGAAETLPSSDAAAMDEFQKSIDSAITEPAASDEGSQADSVAESQQSEDNQDEDQQESDDEDEDDESERGDRE